jgi:hypothetical protein
VGDDRLENSGANSALHIQLSARCTFSIAMAIPIPPPMQSAATP